MRLFVHFHPSEPFLAGYGQPLSKGIPMSVQCPRCYSMNIQTHNRAKHAGGVIGGVGGTASGIAGALSGAEVGGTVGVWAGPFGLALGTLAGALIGGLVGGATGGIAGAKLGEVVDARVLENHQCLDCGHHFSQSA